VFNLRAQFEKFVGLPICPWSSAWWPQRGTANPIGLHRRRQSHLTVLEQQTLLELPDLGTTLERTTFYLTRQLEKLELVQQIRDRVKAGWTSASASIS